VTGETLKAAIREEVDIRSRIVTDENSAYRGIGLEYAGGHESVCHSTREYARGDVHTNTAESSFALVKRGIMGIYHNVSKEHLHRYLWQFDFLWNHRKLNDGERTELAIRGAEGKRLLYKGPVDSVICWKEENMDNLANENERENTPQSKTVNTGDREFDEAVERVYRKYGSDLPAFVRDVQRDIQKVHSGSEVQRRVVRINDW
jgi:hypothetical protein